jgi:hypothetical protein
MVADARVLTAHLGCAPGSGLSSRWRDYRHHRKPANQREFLEQIAAGRTKLESLWHRHALSQQVRFSELAQCNQHNLVIDRHASLGSQPSGY